jgi:hypothetical protein
VRRKAPNLIAGVVTLVVLAMGPLSASSADVIWHCPPGTKDHHYCIKEIHCNKLGSRQHDCRSQDH